MWSRRAACESITTRRRFRAGALLAGVPALSPPVGAAAPSPPGDPSAGFVADDFALGAALACGAGAFGAAFWGPIAC
jgi:hypothetical protein